MKNAITARFASVLAIGLAISQCKTVQNSGSGTLAGTAKAKPNTIDLSKGGNADLDWKQAAIEPISVISAKDGLVELGITVRAQSKLAQAPHVKLVDDNGGATVAEGDLFSSGTAGTYFRGQIDFDAKASATYTLIIDHGGALTGGLGNGSVYGNYYDFAKPKKKTLSAQDSFDMTDRMSDLDLPLKLKVDAAGPIDVHFSANIQPITTGVKNSNRNGQACACEITATLEENGKQFPFTVREQGGEFDANLSYDLPAGTYNFLIKATPLKGDSIVSVSAYASPKNNAGSGNKVTLGVLQMGFDQSNKKTGRLANKPFGFAIDAEFDSEGKIDMNMTVTRFLNKADPKNPFPETAKFGLFQGAPTPGAQPIGATALQSNKNNYRGAFVWDWTQGNYTLLSSPTDFDPNDLVAMNASMAVSDLTIKDGGEPLANFTDKGALSATPPMDYKADQDPKASPFPAVTPVDMAMKSVLEAMEQTRDTFHQRLPKGVKRGPNNAIDPNTISACLANQAEHWSDIMIHYYCQHGQARACYTNSVRGGKTRKEAFDDCSQNDAAFKWVAANQGTVFQYVMFSQTFAFDAEQQQRVINAFYRINKPDDRQECNAKRPRRAIDPTDGTHCLAKKTYGIPMRSLGR